MFNLPNFQLNFELHNVGPKATRKSEVHFLKNIISLFLLLSQLYVLLNDELMTESLSHGDMEGLT
jgi:hypothetical protein